MAILRDALVDYSCLAAGPADRAPAPVKVAVAARDRAGDAAFAELYVSSKRRTPASCSRMRQRVRRARGSSRR